MSLFDPVIAKIERKDFSKDEVNFEHIEDGYEFHSYLYKKGNANKLYVVLNGALAADRKTAKAYQRWSWHPLFDGHVLYMADPTLFKHLDANLAWYIGDKDHQFHDFLACFIQSIAAKTGIALDHVVLYGSSGGGFAALKLAGLIGQGITAVAINPQMNAFLYKKEHVDHYLDVCWKDVPQEILRENPVFDTLNGVSNTNCRILFVQNVQDTFHYKNHFIPFLERFNIFNPSIKSKMIEQNGRIRYMVYDHPSGHAAEPKEMLPEIIQNINYLVDNVSFTEKKFFIIGSSISRDIFLGKRSKVISSNEYFPRFNISRLALSAAKLSPTAVKDVSPFQAKIIRQDIQNELCEALTRTQFDYVLMDFIDQRYGLIEYKDTFITDSYELGLSKLIAERPGKKQIPAGSDEFYRLWELGFKHFIEHCASLNVVNKILINKVYWSETVDDGQKIMNYDIEKIKLNNMILDRLYQIVENYLPDGQFIEYPDTVFVAKRQHKWGVMPFHYIDDFYDLSFEKLKEFS